MTGMEKKKKRKETQVHECWWLQVSAVSAVVLWVKSGEDTRKCQDEEVGGLEDGDRGGGLENKGVVSQVLSHPKLQQGAENLHVCSLLFTHSTIRRLYY